MIAISYASNALFWEAVTQSLQDEQNIHLFTIANSDDMETFLKNPASRILIVEQNSDMAEFHTNYQEYFEVNPRLSIVTVNPTGVETMIRVNNLGKSLFVKLLQTIIEDRPIDTPDEIASNISVLRAQDFVEGSSSKTGISQKQNNTWKHNGRQTLRDEWATVKNWLDIRFHLSLAKGIPGGGEANVPAWAMSLSTAREIIGGIYKDSDVAQLEHALESSEKALSQLWYKTPKHTGSSSLSALQEAFRLTDLEQKIFLVILAVELDARYARVIGYINDDLMRRRPTPSSLAYLLDVDGKYSTWEIRQILAGDSQLSQFKLVIEDEGDTQPSSDAGWQIAEDMVHYLLAGPQKAFTAQTGLQLVTTHALYADQYKAENAEKIIANTLANWRDAKNRDQHLPVLQIIDAHEECSWFIELCKLADEPLVILDMGHSRADENASPDHRISVAVRAAVLENAVLYIHGLSEPANKTHHHSLQKYLAYSYPKNLRIAVHVPELVTELYPHNTLYVQACPLSYTALKSLWQISGKAIGIPLTYEELHVLAMSLQFSSSQMQALLNEVKNSGDDDSSEESIDKILIAAKRFRYSAVPAGVSRVDPSFTWDDIVLPTKLGHLLKTIPAHIRHSATVLDDWGYRSRMPYGHGVTALFCGPSGTGKTMAAQIIASELGSELFQVDLSKTISKYIGETEKNLDAVFDAAEKAGAVLLFDEADALFGKRTEVRDAHDRYANVEVAYLLQRMERFSGLAILTTNLRQNLDKAFMRRLRFVAEFAMPGPSERETIWQRSFPSDAPVAGDVNFKFLARRLELAGGNIQQIAIRAAFSAASTSQSIQMSHIVNATYDELQKLGMGNAQSSLAEFIPETRCAP